MISSTVPLCIFAILAFAATGYAGWAEDFAECSSKYQVQPNDLNNLRTQRAPETREGKCVMACMMKKVNLITAQNTFNSESMKAMAANIHQGSPKDVEIAKKVADACASELGASQQDECEIAIKVSECIMRKGTEMGLSPPRQ